MRHARLNPRHGGLMTASVMSEKLVKWAAPDALVMSGGERAGAINREGRPSSNGMIGVRGNRILRRMTAAAERLSSCARSGISSAEHNSA